MFTFITRKESLRKLQCRERRCSRPRLEGLENRYLLTGIIRSPVAVLQNTGGNFSSTYAIEHTIDHSGLSADFTSGVTDFDMYIGGHPTHTYVAAGFEWFTPEGVHASTIVYDMGAEYVLDRLALWNEEASGIATMAVSTSNDSSFATSTAVGTFNPTDTPNSALEYGAQVFDLVDTTARYVRLQVTGPQNPSIFDGTAMGEIAFATSQLKLESVTFSGAKYHTITSDPNAAGGTTDFATQHWLDVNLNGSAQDSGDHDYPALYEANSTMSVSATWKLSSTATLSGTIKARGDGPGNLDVPATAVTQSGDTLSLAATAVSNPFGSTAEYDPHFEIKWQLSFDGGNTWSDAGTSDNTIYVSAAAPLADPDSGKLFETVVFLAISNTDGDSAEADLIADSWGEFTDRSVSRVDSSAQNGPRGSALHYYQSHQTNNVTVAGLLKDADGQCSTWAKLFLDMLRVNGISKAGDYILVEPKTDDGFLVKNWDFNPAGGKSTDPAHPYLNIPSGFTAAGYTWQYADVTDAAGITGQSTTNPASVFNNHQIALINGTYYDPSYGATYTSLQDMEQKAIAGYFKYQASYRVREADLGVDLNGNGTTTDVLRVPAFLIRKPNLASPNLKGTQYNF